MNAVQNLSDHVGIKTACESLQVPRATFYRQLKPKETSSKSINIAPPLALNSEERQDVIDILHSERFQDKAPYQIYATLLDEGKYYCSIRTMYRILSSEHGCVTDRRNQVQRPRYSKPELLATRQNQVWSWDITKLKGPAKWTYFHLYVIIDIYSRYVVGWMVANREQTALAKRLIQESCLKQSILKGQLTIHADRGSSMRSKGVAFLLADLGITKTHNRPHVSNDNPYSESQFKTLKYCPEFPKRFGSLQDARQFCQGFFNWYNKEHHHTGIALLTPEQVHYGLADEIISTRTQVLQSAFEKKPNRFKGKLPKVPQLPEAVWINKPLPEESDIKAS